MTLYDEIQAVEPTALASGDYQQIADALNAARPAVLGKVERADFAIWAASTGMRSKIEDHSTDAASPLRSAALACRDFILGAAESIDFAQVPNQMMLGAWVAMEQLSIENRDNLLAMATKPAPKVTAAHVEVAMKNDDGTYK